VFAHSPSSGIRVEVQRATGVEMQRYDFKAGTIRVDESSDQRSSGRIGPCKNAAAYRTVALHDSEGQKAMRALKRFLGACLPDELVFRSKSGGVCFWKLLF
jgi:hypothetical protein